jgi:monolysocardiolipin acyltransferase
LLLAVGGKFVVIENENYQVFKNQIESRGAQVPLITVSNHRSVFDDPGILGCIVPGSMGLKVRNIRWNICAEEVCFQENMLFEAFFAAGKTISIFRGGGINQPNLLDFARQAANGDWLHIFPEGRVTQLDQLGGRMSEKRQDIGSLKWGIAKIIAHAPVRPVVIPYFHAGMEAVMPMDKDLKVLTTLPLLGKTVTVLFGEELHFDDLIDEHQRQFGALWKYHGGGSSSSDGVGANMWTSTPSDFMLYQKITMRIEAALNKLNLKNNNGEISSAVC